MWLEEKSADVVIKSISWTPKYGLFAKTLEKFSKSVWCDLYLQRSMLSVTQVEVLTTCETVRKKTSKSVCYEQCLKVLGIPFKKGLLN